MFFQKVALLLLSINIITIVAIIAYSSTLILGDADINEVKKNGS